MIETTVGHIRSREFGQAWSRILSHPFPGDLRYKIVKMEKAMKAELDPALQTMEEIATKLGTLEPITKNYQIKEENKDEWSKEVTKIHDIKINIDRPKIAMKELDSVQLSTLDIIAMEFLLHEFEAITGGENEGQEKAK